jgi:hypothetical protein
MDVHAPHEPLHTWRDFWIHLGTITIGLLIAISLEQSVEGLHHVHQRHQLEKDLRAEGERNIEIVAKDAQVLAATRAWELSLRKNVDAVRPRMFRIPFRDSQRCLPIRYGRRRKRACWWFCCHGARRRCIRGWTFSTS